MFDLAIKVGELCLRLLDHFSGRPRLKVLIKWYLPTKFAPRVRGYLIVANPGSKPAQIRRAFLRQHYPDATTICVWWKDEVRSIPPHGSVEYYFELDKSMNAGAARVIDGCVEDYLLKEHRSRPDKGRKAFFKRLLKKQAETRALALMLTLALATSGCAQTPSSPAKPAPVTLHTVAAHAPTKTQPPTITIKIINAKTNHPITDEKLNVALKEDQIGSVAMPTDKHGIIEVKTGDATILRILSNMYADCRPRAELYTNYSIAEIHTNGITTGNLCSASHPKPQPGELILFEIPKTYVPKNPEPPITHLPHSDEYPN